MAWLLHNYFLPILNPVSAQQIVTAPIRPLAPILKVYKNTMKIMTRDVSLVNQYKPRILNILRDIERWISEAKVAANANAGDFGNAPTQSFDGILDGDVKEIWALERFSDSLVEKGMLVPLSKKFVSCSLSTDLQTERNDIEKGYTPSTRFCPARLQ
jgi:ribosomal biogenesis protein LAS1